MVIITSGLFIFFAYESFKPKNKVDWRSFGAFSAFLVALFTEMYGFPLTIYLLSSFFGNRFPQLNLSHNSGHLWEVFLGNQGDPHFGLLHILSYGLIFFGLALIANSWKILYQAAKENKIATIGPYKYIRHPQYAGFLIIIIGFLLQWPTIPTLLMAPVLFIMYVRLAKKEEQATIQTNPEYLKYQKTTPAFIPRLFGKKPVNFYENKTN